MRKTCHVLLAIDESGSMHHLASDVRGGFNQYIEGLAAEAGTRWRFTVALFSDRSPMYPAVIDADVPPIPRVRYLCRDAKIADVPRLDARNYVPLGATPLLDAVGDLVSGHGTRSDEDRVLVVVQTDGQENSSQEWNLPGVKKLVEQREATGRWGFVYLGAGVDTWEGNRMGFASVQTRSSRAGTAGTYSGMTASTVGYAAGGTAEVFATEVAAASVEADEAADDPAEK